MQLVAGTLQSNGRGTWQVSQLTTGAKQLPLAILLEDDNQGAIFSTAYVSGTRCRMYVPIGGEEINMLLGDVSGTGDIVTIGDLFGIETATGKIKANSSYTSTPFQAMESLAALTADAWVYCQVT